MPETYEYRGVLFARMGRKADAQRDLATLKRLNPKLAGELEQFLKTGKEVEEYGGTDSLDHARLPSNLVRQGIDGEARQLGKALHVGLSFGPRRHRSHLLRVARNAHVLSGYFKRVTRRQLRIGKNWCGLLGEDGLSEKQED